MEIGIEFFVVAIILIIVVGTLITVLSSKDRKLFFRIRSSEQIGAIDAQQKAIGELFTRYNVSIPNNNDVADISSLGVGIENLMTKAVEFDLKNSINFGVDVSNVLAKYLEGRLHLAGINEFDALLNLVKAGVAKETFTVLRRAGAIKNTFGKVKSTADLFREKIVKGRETQNKEKHGNYYIGYLNGIVREMCKYDNVEYGDVCLTPVLQEIQRVFGGDEADLFGKTRTQLDGISITKFGTQGLSDGLIDGSYAANPNNPAPYFEKLVLFFKNNE